MKYTVYLRTNKVNGKQYVGQTKDWKGRESDWKVLSARYANKVITDDRERYGLDNWSSEILAIVETQEEAWELEQKYIKELNTRFPNGYNFSNGGKDQTGTKHTEETRKRMSEAHIGKPNPKSGEARKGRVLSAEWKSKISESLKGRKISDEQIELLRKINTGRHHSEETKRKIGEHFKGKTSWMKGKHHTEEAKRKLSEAKKGKPNLALSKKVYLYKDGVLVDEYPSVSEAARQLGFSQSEISVNCRGGRYKNGKWIVSKTYKGYKFSYELL